MGRVTRSHPVVRMGTTAPGRKIDTLAVEEPLEIRLNGDPYLVTMRTPGDDVDLVHGLLHSESVIAGREDVATARYCVGIGPDGLNTYNVLDVALRPSARLPEKRRQVDTTSACGICGTTTIEQVRAAARYPADPDILVPVPLVLAAPGLLRERQRAFDRTGGVHAAGLLALDGTMLCVREDVGRHNAVDKVIGWAIREDRLPLRQAILVVSGRASYELTQKAILAGLPLLAAVSAPSSLAAELAVDAGLILAGFVRDGSMNVYAHADRLTPASERPGRAEPHPVERSPIEAPPTQEDGVER